jgi:hypothetical protein
MGKREKGEKGKWRRGTKRSDNIYGFPFRLFPVSPFRPFYISHFAPFAIPLFTVAPS